MRSSMIPQQDLSVNLKGTNNSSSFIFFQFQDHVFKGPSHESGRSYESEGTGPNKKEVSGRY